MVDRWRGVVWVEVGIATRLRGRFGGGYLCEMDLVAVSKGYQPEASFVDKREWFLISLLGFVGVLELKNIDIQGQLMLAHFAQYNRSCFVKFWICQ